MSITKKGSKSASGKSPRRKCARGFVLPERKIRDFAINLRIREAHRAVICLLIIDKAANAIAEGEKKSSEVNQRTVREMADDDACKQIRRIIKSIHD